MEDRKIGCLVEETRGMSPYVAAIVLLVVTLGLWGAWNQFGSTTVNSRIGHIEQKLTEVEVN